MNYSSFEQQYMVKKVPATVPGASGKARFQMEKSAARQIQDPPEVKDILESVGYVADEYLDIGAATVKGVTQGTIGLPGDLEGLVRTVANSLGADISEETLAPTTEEVKKWFDQNIGKVGDGKNPYETIGEFGALGKPTELAVQGAVKGVKATKNVIDNLDESVLRPTGSIQPGAFLPNKVVKLNTQKKKKEEKPRDISSGHAADLMPINFGSPAHKMNMKMEQEFTPGGYPTFSADVGDNYENLKFFISSRRGTKEFNEEVMFYRKLFEIKDNPEAEITVYRASPTNDLRYGDLVTPIKSDADFYADESKITRDDVIETERKRRRSGDKPINLNEEKNIKIMDNIMGLFPDNTTPSQVFTYKVKAKDIRWDGNNGLVRWGYFPEGEIKNISQGGNDGN